MYFDQYKDGERKLTSSLARMLPRCFSKDFLTLMTLLMLCNGKGTYFGRIKYQFGLYFRYVKCPPWTCACCFRSYETWSNMSGEARRPWAINNFEGVDVTRHNPLDTMWSIGLPPALSRRMFSPLEILSSRKKRFMWGPECISRCLRSGSLHPAQCHQICT